MHLRETLTGVRWWRVMVVLACLAFVVAACSHVPLTGRRQLLLVSEADEIQLGITEYKDVLAKSTLSKDEATTERIRTIGSRIAAATGKADYKWEFNLIQADTVVNAFCLPGGKVAVYTGIKKVAATDDELATVMSHEISHAVARHGGERMSQLLLVQLGGVALDEALKTKTERTLELAQVAYGMGTTLALVLPYSRAQESEADYMGLIFQAKAGYDPRAALDFWQKMEKEFAGKEPPQFLSTHPSNAKRIEDIKAAIPEAMKYYQPSGKK
ncbi:MAG TPA: M48 family metallopeptidase [bacterium]|nr:M48 family metallopeptidase [bacterium]